MEDCGNGICQSLISTYKTTSYWTVKTFHWKVNEMVNLFQRKYSHDKTPHLMQMIWREKIQGRFELGVRVLKYYDMHLFAFLLRFLLSMENPKQDGRKVDYNSNSTAGVTLKHEKIVRHTCFFLTQGI